MSYRFSNNVILWAREHDWFYAALNDGTLWVVDRYTKDGELHEEVIQWTRSLRELREWAGY